MVEPFAQCRVVALRQSRDELVRAGLLARDLDPFAVAYIRDVAQPDVLGGRRLVRDVVLEHGANLSPQL